MRYSLGVIVTSMAATADIAASQAVPSQAARSTEVQERAQGDRELANGQAPQPRAAASRAAMKVTITDGALTLTADRQSLHTVLGLISSRTRIPIVVSDSLTDARVSIALRAVPLEDGLRRLLSAYDAFYLFSANDGNAPASIQTIWVFARGEGHDLKPVPPTVWGDTKDLEARLDDSDPGVRSQAIEALIERLGERGLPTVQRGLLDPDEGVRLATLSAAGNAGIEVPASDLHAVVLTDELHRGRLRSRNWRPGRRPRPSRAPSATTSIRRSAIAPGKSSASKRLGGRNSSPDDARARERRADSVRTPVTPTGNTCDWSEA